MLYGWRERGVHGRADADDAVYVCDKFCALGDGLPLRRLIGSPWDEDKAMMGRWGLDGMRSFEQTNVARKEGAALGAAAVRPGLAAAESAEPSA